MTTLKQLVDGAIKAGSKWSYPNSKIHVATIAAGDGNWNNDFNYTCPQDGFLGLKAPYADSQYISQESTGAHCYSINSSAHYGWAIAKKGDRLRVHVGKSTQNADVYFYPLSGQA